MSFDFINDLFGRFRKGKVTKFSDIEQRAIALLRKMERGRISNDEFFTGFGQLIKEFRELMGTTIDEDTPLWLNLFAANVFLRWKDWHILRTMHATHPEKFANLETEKAYQRIAAMNYDEWLRDKIRYCLKNL